MQNKNTIPLFKSNNLNINVQITVLFIIAVYCIENNKDSQEAIFILISIIVAFAIQSSGVFLIIKKYGLPIKNISIYPFGLFFRIPTKVIVEKLNPFRTLLLNSAGLILNLIFALLIYFLFFNYSFEKVSYLFSQGGFLVNLFICNLVLAVFSLLPIYPLPGSSLYVYFGNILKNKNLRASLPSNEMNGILQKPDKTPLINAVQLKKMLKFSQGLAILFSIFFLTFGYLAVSLVFGILFTFILKLQIEQTILDNASNLKIKDIMRPLNEMDFFKQGTSIKDALNISMKSFQEYFPVVTSNKYIGIIERTSLLKFRPKLDNSAYPIVDLAKKELQEISPEDTLETAVDNISIDYSSPIVVIENDVLLGIVNIPHLMEALFVKALEKNTPPDIDNDFNF